MQAFLAYIACMSNIQYTVRQVPARLDGWLRKKARQEGKSLNRAVLEALSEGCGLGRELPRQHDLDAFCGTWEEDPAFDRAVKEMDRVDAGMWS